MEISELNDKLRFNARNLGLCDQWFGEWSGKEYSQQELIDRYVKGLDFCIKHGYPTNKFIKDNFDIELLRENNIIVDDTYSLLNPRVGVILGESNTKVRCNGYTVSKLYVKDASKVDVYIKEHAHIIIHIYDDAEVNILEGSSTNTPKVVIHGELSKCNVAEGAKVRTVAGD